MVARVDVSCVLSTCMLQITEMNKHAVCEEKDGLQHEKVSHSTHSFWRIEIELAGTFANVKLAFIITVYQKEIPRWCILPDRESVVTQMHKMSIASKEILASPHWNPRLELLVEIQVEHRFNPADPNIQRCLVSRGPYIFMKLLQPLSEERFSCRKPRLHVQCVAFVLDRILGIDDSTSEKLCKRRFFLFLPECVQKCFM